MVECRPNADSAFRKSTPSPAIGFAPASRCVIEEITNNKRLSKELVTVWAPTMPAGVHFAGSAHHIVFSEPCRFRLSPEETGDLPPTDHLNYLQGPV